MGGAGVGKTTALKHAFGDLAAEFRFVKDTNVASVKSGEKILENIRKYPGNKDTRFFVVFRDAEDSWVNGVIQRMLTKPERRIVTIDDWISTRKSYKAFIDLYDKVYGDPSIKTPLIVESVNENGKASFKKINLEKLEQFIKDEDVGAIKKMATDYVNQLHKDKAITDDELSMFLTGEVGNVVKGKVVTGGSGRNAEGIGQVQETVAGGTKDVPAAKEGTGSGTGKKEAAAVR